MRTSLQYYATVPACLGMLLACMGVASAQECFIPKSCDDFTTAPTTTDTPTPFTHDNFPTIKGLEDENIQLPGTKAHTIPNAVTTTTVSVGCFEINKQSAGRGSAGFLRETDQKCGENKTRKKFTYTAVDPITGAVLGEGEKVYNDPSFPPDCGGKGIIIDCPVKI